MTSLRLKVYSDPTHYQAHHRGHLSSFLRPFWKDSPFSDEERIQMYGAQINQYVPVDEPQQADLFVLPMQWTFYYQTGQLEQAVNFINSVRPYRKPIVTWNGGDFSTPLPVDNVYLFQANCYQSRRKQYEFAVPPFIRDLQAELQVTKISLRRKQEMPVVGFCGQANDPLVKKFTKPIAIGMRNVRFHMGLSPFEPHSLLPPTLLRAKVLRILEQSSQVETDFLKRTHYRGGDEKSPQVLRNEYLSNIVHTDYTVCVRGTGNWSQRLYEVLCLGRIPIFINTDCVMPYDQMIDWQKYVVWVEEKELASLPQKLLDFHHSLDDDAFFQRQRDCRQLWEDRLSYSGFFTHFPEHFPEN